MTLKRSKSKYSNWLILAMILGSGEVKLEFAARYAIIACESVM